MMHQGLDIAQCPPLPHTLHHQTNKTNKMLVGLGFAFLPHTFSWSWSFLVEK